jgi:hypothetical protein
MDAESQLLADKDAEIERLKGDHAIVRGFLDDADGKLREHEKLITELADALSWYVEPESDNGLLQRAREATK